MKKILLFLLLLALALPPAGAMAEADAHSFMVTEIKYGGMAVGRCTAPAGWELSAKVSYGASIEEPWTLQLTANEPQGPIMTYTSPQCFIQILRMDSGEQHQEGVYSPQFHVTMLTYRDAPAYCDYMAGRMAPAGTNLTRVDDNQFPGAQALLQRKEQALYAKANALRGASSVGVDWVDCTVCLRRYRADIAGLPSYICVMAGVEAVQSTARLWGPLAVEVSSLISWKPIFCYTIVCPVDRWDTYGPIYMQFVENSGVSDQFLAANERLSTELLNIISGGIDLSGGAAYSEGVLRGEAGSGEDYTDRYSDYLFDQNDYTLSDGSHVKVSTAYDYVYEGDNYTVYYSDSALYQPGGAAQLTPNR